MAKSTAPGSTAPVDGAPLVVICGATGTGKSALSLELAARFAEAGLAAEVVNADAMQLYRGMDIGTAKLSAAERAVVPHHLFDVLEVTDEASVAAYQAEARAIIEGIRARGAVPLLVGGSGLYVSSTIQQFAFPPTDEGVRQRLEAELAEWGPGMLHRRLRAKDPAAAEAIDAQNARRVVRALEVIEVTGERFSARLPEEPTWWLRDTRVLNLTYPRELLVPRLDARVEQMWANGLLEEVAELVPRGIERGVTASRAIGYAQALGELRGELTREAAIGRAQSLTRRYARRQVSWFKRLEGAIALDAGNPLMLDIAWAAVSRPSAEG